MKKFKLSYQITLVFLVSFILTSILLGILITNRLDGVYENNIFEKLESAGKDLRLSQNITKFPNANKFAYIIYNSNEKIYSTTDNINNFIDENSIKLLINKAAAQEQNSMRYTNMINNKKFYYVILNYQGFFDIQKEDIFIILTDGTLKKNMMRETTLQTLLVSLIAFILGYLIILLWVTTLVKDTKHITKILNKIGRNHYKTEIKTKRHDEIGEIVDNIESMRKQIIENEKQKQEIIQGVSHDLKTPIAIIQSYAEAIKDDMCDPKEAAAITEKECKRLNTKVTNLLRITRLNYIGVKNQNNEKTKMDVLIKEIVLLYSYQTNLKIQTKLDSVEYVGDKESWLVVLENLLDNAIRYGKTKINITLDSKQLTIFNDGSTISKEYLPNIFKAYEKGSNGNFGLGLSIVKKTVELFGYKIRAQNINDGVLFIIEH